MKYLFYIEIFILLSLITLLVVYVTEFGLIFVNVGIFYIFCQLCQFHLIKVSQVVRRPKSLLFNFYGDHTYDTYYDVLEKNCWKLIVKERMYHTIRTINFIEYVTFFYSRE